MTDLMGQLDVDVSNLTPYDNCGYLSPTEYIASPKCYGSKNFRYEVFAENGAYILAHRWQNGQELYVLRVEGGPTNWEKICDYTGLDAHVGGFICERLQQEGWELYN